MDCRCVLFSVALLALPHCEAVQFPVSQNALRGQSIEMATVPQCTDGFPLVPVPSTHCPELVQIEDSFTDCRNPNVLPGQHCTVTKGTGCGTDPDIKNCNYPDTGGYSVYIKQAPCVLPSSNATICPDELCVEGYCRLPNLPTPAPTPPTPAPTPAPTDPTPVPTPIPPGETGYEQLSDSYMMSCAKKDGPGYPQYTSYNVTDSQCKRRCSRTPECFGYSSVDPSKHPTETGCFIWLEDVVGGTDGNGGFYFGEMGCYKKRPTPPPDMVDEESG